MTLRSARYWVDWEKRSQGQPMTTRVESDPENGPNKIPNCESSVLRGGSGCLKDAGQWIVIASTEQSQGTRVSSAYAEWDLRLIA